MRPLVLAIILLHRFDAAAGELAVQGPMTRLVPTTQQLFDMCGTTGDYDACTRFVAFRLDATCSPASQGFRASASATFLPWVLLRNIRQLGHEQEHITDVRVSVSRYLQELESQVFRSGVDCEQKVLQERALFGERLRGYALESNQARHASLRVKSTRVASGVRRP